MACRESYKANHASIKKDAAMPQKLLFGVNTTVPANSILQNNLTMFEWVIKNKIPPNFWGRNIAGENHLTVNEISFLHDKGCKIAAIYPCIDTMQTEEQGVITAKKAIINAIELNIPKGSAIFLEITHEEITFEFLLGFARTIYNEDYTPAFKVNTDAEYNFDELFGRAMAFDRNTVNNCIIWATAPILPEYVRITTTHLIHPDNWQPFAPSGVTNNDIAVWQYGWECHPIYNNENKEVVFNSDIVKNEDIIISKMF